MDEQNKIIDSVKLFYDSFSLVKKEFEKKLASGKKLELVETLALQEANWLLDGVILGNPYDEDYILNGCTAPQNENEKLKYQKGLKSLTKAELIERLSTALCELDRERKLSNQLDDFRMSILDQHELIKIKTIQASSNKQKGKRSNTSKFKGHVEVKNKAMQILKEMSTEEPLEGKDFKLFCVKMRSICDKNATLRNYFFEFSGLKSTK